MKLNKTATLSALLLGSSGLAQATSSLPQNHTSHCNVYSDTALEECQSSDGLNTQERLSIDRDIADLNALKIIVVSGLKLDRAQRFSYSFPDPVQVANARATNLERARKLSELLELSKELK